ncbi:hypothetical protein B0H17DRAFT_1184583 [Mycena rosella]|uniref:Uncharacterized protein n=1 Tax=Mycena rosella TaxID=1033263 RepID=A0AAD7CVJ5_MYCRO|nr:hypothetical protein B0H17DRAFT_1184583 [Mycena rosella]
MRFAFPSRAKKRRGPKPTPVSSSPKLQLCRDSTLVAGDLLWTSLLALKESADAFPPLKSAMAGVVAICEIAERAKHSKADTREIAERTKGILDVIAEAVPNPSVIPAPMLQSIEQFTALLDEIRCSMEAITLTGGLMRRLAHLNRNERALQEIKVVLEDAYRDFVAASALRLEVQQAHLAVQQTQLALKQAQTYIELEKVSAVTGPPTG